MKILKFGGSSISTPEKIRNIKNIILKSQRSNGQIAVIVSAFGGVTDQLIEAAASASQGREEYKNIFKNLEGRHINTTQDLIPFNNQEVLANLQIMFGELQNVLHGIFLIRELTLKTLDFVMGFGERLSAYIINESIKKDICSEYLDAREVVITDENFGRAKVKLELTCNKIKDYFNQHKALQIITGFIGSTHRGETTTMGRGGSDYTASLFGAALAADEIEIWTDVNGVMSANPTKVAKAFSISNMTYEDAMELSHFGAKVIYPPTMQPALSQKIPIRIKNSFNPDFPGTVISAALSSPDFLIKGISSINDIALLRIQGSGMIGVAGIAMRLFGALAKQNINIILITQASSEHSICFAVKPESAEQAKKFIEEEFKLEIQAQEINEISIERELSIVAVVGKNMKKIPGVSGKIFQALGNRGINVVAVAQGSSELNISIVVSKNDEIKALNAIHDAFFSSKDKFINIFLVGTGLIGGTLLKQIREQVNFLKEKKCLDIRIIGLADIDKMIFDEKGIPLDSWKEKINSGESVNLQDFVEKMQALNLPNSIFVDCTANQEITNFYEKILDSGISIVTPNKKANSSSYQKYQNLKNFAEKNNAKFLYETNVGAGLPIINTLCNILATGDKILKIEAILSGTLSYIFNSFKGDKKFSEVVREARERGYTEPDPRDDLNGLDVARKILILAREAGLHLEMENISIENLIPQNSRNANSIEEFFMELQKADHEFEFKKKNAEASGKVLRYIAALEHGNATTALKEVNASHPFYSLSSSDNVISFTTKYYNDRPLVIKGPGAGADVTAAGVLSDILKINS